MKIKFLTTVSILIGTLIISSGFVKPKKVPASKIKLVKKAVEEISFAKFLSHFEKIEMPYKKELQDVMLNEDQINSVIKASALKSKKASLRSNSNLVRSNYIPEIANGAISRMGPPKIEPVARFYPNEQVVAVIYKPYYHFNGSQESYMLTVYDFNGQLLFPKSEGEYLPYSGFLLAHSGIENLGTCSIDKSGYITKKLYKKDWKNDPSEVGYKENTILSCTLTETEFYKISDKGILEKKDKLGSNAIALLD